MITAVLVKKQGTSTGPSLATATQPPRVAAGFAPGDVASVAAGRPAMPGKQSLSDEDAALVAAGRQLMVAGDIPNARLVLQKAAEADNATAALELGATYDPTFLQQLKTVRQGDVRMARLWYEKAKDLGSTEAAVRLERLRSVPNPRPVGMSDD